MTLYDIQLRTIDGGATTLGAYQGQTLLIVNVSKIDVNGADAHPLYKYLKLVKKGLFGRSAIPWNFSKFLVDKDGAVVHRYSCRDTPEAIERDLIRLLG